VASGVPLSDAATQRGLVIATESPDATAWRVFLSRALLALGASLCLAGVICFVAYNWERVGRFGKFSVLALAIVASAVFAWRAIPKLTGEVALLAAAVLVGALLAVFGQTYQTGADPYGLFGVWLLIILPWVFASRLSALWIVALALLDTTIILYWTQVIGMRDPRDGIWLPVLLGVLHWGVLALWEWQRRRPSPWLTERWAQRLIGVAALFPLWLTGAVFIIAGSKGGAGAALGFVLFLSAVAAALWYYGRVKRELFMVTIAVVATMLLANLLAGRILFQMLHTGLIGGLVLAGLVVWQITLGLTWYRSARDAA
jgi:uncharacterized membrane protein